MLQQTQAGRVVAPYGAFLRRFPTPASCARAPVGEVVRAWSGLGYNRRAVHLHAAARAVVHHHGGTVPDNLEALRALPGVGPYTARAVLAFSFERPVAVVDVNVGRVLTRAVAGAPLSPSALQRLADDLLPAARPWLWNQSILEIGATRCTARRPGCDDCTLRRLCLWRARGRPAPDPARPPWRQGPFEGSDRQGRGRLLAALRQGPVPSPALASACGWPDDTGRARRVADDLVGDGLACRRPGGGLRLP